MRIQLKGTIDHQVTVARNQREIISQVTVSLVAIFLAFQTS